MSNIEKIRQEIERLKKILEESTYYLDNSQQALGYSFALDDFKEFIDSLPEEKPSEELEEAAEDFANQDCVTFISRKKGFIAGAEWQKKQMELDGIVTLTESDFDAEKEKASEWGYNLCKEQMMKEVKYGVVCKNGERDEEDVWIELNPGSLPDYKDTDPIDFIIVKK